MDKKRPFTLNLPITTDNSFISTLTLFAFIYKRFRGKFELETGKRDGKLPTLHFPLTVTERLS